MKLKNKMDKKIIDLVKNQNKIEPAALLAFISVETGGQGVAELALSLKLWTDKWDSVGETKGGANVPLMYKSFWVTSNYTIDEIFSDLNDAAILAAIKRRFVVIPIISRDDFGTIEKPAGYDNSITQTKIEEEIEKKNNPSKSPNPLPHSSLWGSMASFPLDDQNGGDDESLSRIFKP